MYNIPAGDKRSYRINETLYQIIVFTYMYEVEIIDDPIYDPIETIDSSNCGLYRLPSGYYWSMSSLKCSIYRHFKHI